ncbi:hypothetical protein [Azospira restricta]|uniref:Uncharacterized protein n=1 Tax=Azospira restricta TaxID=404405 RepID=A0A974PVS7_9RHOO|nr:hypothetical protein [Azospira restricta]QRJ62413.1 hypothetical protein IWH25_11495 [Azospira restricta]
MRAETFSEAVPAASAFPSPVLRLSSALAAIGGSAPLPAEAPPLALQLSATLSPTGAAAALPVAEPAPLAAARAGESPRLYAAADSAAISADVDDDEEGGDAPTGPPVVLGEMPGRRPPPLPGGLAGLPPGEEAPLVPGVPGLPGMPCMPGLPCVPMRPPGSVAGPYEQRTEPPAGLPFPDAAGSTGGPGRPGDGKPDAGIAGSGWGLAPIRWGGSVGVQMRRQQMDGGSSSSTVGLFNLRASSYIYEPWLAQVSGNLGITSGRSSSTSSAASGTGSSGNQSDTQSTVIGGGMLHLFPMSRFPFMATFDRSDSRANGTFVSTDYTNTRIGLRQSYRTESGAQNASLGFDRSVVETSQSGLDTVNAVYGNYSHAFDNQTTQMNGRISQSRRDLNGESSRLINYYARHTYRFEDNLNAETSTMLNDNTLNYRSNGVLANSHGRYLQLNSSVSWRPESEYEDEVHPLSVIAGINLFTSASSFNNESSESKSLSGNVSATYAYSPNLTFMGTGLATRITNSNGDPQLLTNVGGAATYIGDPLTFGKFSYNWNVGGSANRQGGGTSGANRLLAMQGSHSLGRDFPLTTAQSIQLSLSQSVSHSSDQLIGNSTTLNHTAGSTWRIQGGDQSFGSVGLSFSDMVTTGANEGHYRYLYLQVNGNGQLSPRSSLSANLTVQWSMQETQRQVTTSSAGFGSSPIFTDQNKRTNVFGSLNYAHTRAFGVSGLRYNLSFNANTQMVDSRLLGDVAAQPERFTYWLENRFDYRIGMLDLSATGTIIETGGKKNAQVFFRATRQFGKF